MGSMLSRYIRDLTEVAGSEIISEYSDIATTPPLDVGPVSHLDPRSPTAEIVRTPIEVAPCKQFCLDNSPVTSLRSGRRSYLETDLDSLTTRELDSKPENSITVLEESKSSITAGLSSAHLLKLRFLGIDPRSPSSDVARTPIQVPLSRENDEKIIQKFYLDDSISLGSLSSQDISRSSACYSDFTRECSDPSAIISDCEDDIPRETNASLTDVAEDNPSDKASELCFSETHIQDRKSSEMFNSSAESVCKTSTKLTVFCEEDSVNTVLLGKKASTTPDRSSAKKNVRSHTRTPLTPLCNRNNTPNSIIRAKQSQNIEKEKLAKVKILSGADKNKTAGSLVSMNREISSVSTPKSERSDRKLLSKNDENTPISDVRGQWDLDTSIVI